jgi:eight-cysteine-cluster-containing protein
MIVEVRVLLGCLALSSLLGVACSGDAEPLDGAANGGSSSGGGSAGSSGGSAGTSSAGSVGGGNAGGSGGCAPGGCSGELCGEEGEGLISDCVYREEFECYRSARCERQSSGRCGWTQTDELRQCIAQAGNVRTY